jgi:hypothetical protein
MTSNARPALATRVLDVLFGKTSSESEKARILVERPPPWAGRIISALYLVWFLLFSLWGFGKLGWLPEDRETFTIWWLIAINGYGVVVQWISHGVDRHYRTKARRMLKSAAAE